MKKKNTDIELIKDDEIIREEGMCDGSSLTMGIEMRPVTALSVSWMQRNDIFSETKDMIWKSAAFAFLHSEPVSAIREVVNDRASFVDAVDSWIEKNLDHHLQATKIATAMTDALARYMAAASEIVGSRGSALGN